MGRGGFRVGAGRKGFYGEKTVAVKIPISQVEVVKAFLRGAVNDSVIQSNLVTETTDRAGIAMTNKVSEIEKVIAVWEAKCIGKEKSPRWERVHHLVTALKAIL